MLSGEKTVSNHAGLDIKKLFEEAGLYVRDAQLKMIEAVKETLINNEKIVIEAPTATGKSFAYLLGALLANEVRASQGQEKLSIIVSTATVALQEQLIDKDLPFIHQLMQSQKVDFSYQLAKGRSRYLCPRKLHHFNSDDGDLQKEAESLDERLSKDWDGDFDLLEKPVSKALMSEIYNTSSSCSFSRCECYRECPFFNARQGLRKVDIVVVNHSLLLSHLDLGDGAILPKFEDSLYIIDECHHLPDRALRSLSGFASLLGSQTWINDVDKLLNALPAELVDRVLRENWKEVRKNLIQQLTQMQQLIDPMYAKAAKEESIWRMTAINDEILQLATAIKEGAAFYMNQCDKLKTKLDDFAEKSQIHSASSLEKQFTQIGFLLERSKNLYNVWSLMINQATMPPIAKWVIPHEKKVKHEEVKEVQTDMLATNFQDYDIHASPIEAASLLKQVFWQNVQHGVVMCSATVRSLGKFDRFLNATALKKEAKTLLLSSPLNYSKSKLIIADMQYEPAQQDKHIEETAKLLNEVYFKDLHEGALILFTSIHAMEKVYMRLNNTLKKITLIQGDRSKQAMIAIHKKRVDQFKPSIIFGVDSFSEGVDLPGAYLTRLIIHKLPFSVPTNPIDKTRAEWLESIKRKPFMDISLPQASLRLTQMVGRLVRTEADIGEVIILDKRLKTKFYGKALLENLPDFEIVKS